MKTIEAADRSPLRISKMVAEWEFLLTRLRTSYLLVDERVIVKQRVVRHRAVALDVQAQARYSSKVGPPAATRSTAPRQAFFPLKPVSPKREPCSLKCCATSCGFVGSTVESACIRSFCVWEADRTTETPEISLFLFRPLQYGQLRAFSPDDFRMRAS